MNKALAIIGNILTFLIFGVGLLSPLTPSVGMPAMGSLITFVGLPLVFLLNAWRVYAHQVAKYAVVLQGVFILCVTGWLLSLQVGVFSMPVNKWLKTTTALSRLRVLVNRYA